MTHILVWSFAAFTLWYVAIKLYPVVAIWWETLGRGWAKALPAIAFVGLTIYGGSKATITYPRTDADVWYLQDNGSYITNNAVHISFNRNLIVPLTANLFVDGVAHSNTNADRWVTSAFTAYANTMANVFSNGQMVPFDIPYASATNYDWICYTDWTPPPVVHTNGVAYVVWQIGYGKTTNDFAMTRTGVYTNTLRVAPSPAITNSVNIFLPQAELSAPSITTNYQGETP